MQWHNQDLNTLEGFLKTNFSEGLTSEEAAQKLADQGPNRLDAQPPRPLILRFFDQFRDFMVIILLIAAAISAFLAITQQEGDLFEPFIILAIVVINAILGVAQESKAQKALEALKTLAAPHAKVLRDGKAQTVPAEEVVPGDVILLEAGDYVPADARLLESASLKCEESALTGESVPVDKVVDAKVADLAAIGDRVNMVFSGCGVTYGRGKAVVVATGMNTQMGTIAALLDKEEETQTPMQRRLAQLGKYLGILAIFICIVIFALGIYQGQNLMEMFMVAVSLAVAAIPEGLPAIVTIVLALGVQRMVKKNAIIRRLPAVETLGSASVICSDKTGTLTQNRMTLKRAWLCGMPATISVERTPSEKTLTLLRLAALCTDATIEEIDGKEVPVGDPTETAIVSAAKAHGLDKKELSRDYPRIGEIPFDSDRKLMTVICKIQDQNVVIVKGAFDVLAARCTSGDVGEGARFVDRLAQDAMRVLAVGIKTIDELPEKLVSEEIESGLSFVGLLGMIDPPREEAKEAVQQCKKAGIRPVMITGDHITTASAIASELGILSGDYEAISGSELSEMSDEELAKNIRRYSVYARVSPTDKIRIVKAWQAAGETVAMTGDGVNDAPALKAADIGCAMGVTGTDVAKGAADMVLTDDNFATIVTAVKEGRGIYDNIKKVVQFLLSGNLGEVLVVFLAMLLGWGAPLLAIHILLVNLITDGLPALALGVEPPERDIMSRKPKPKNEGILSGKFGLVISLQGVMVGLLTLLAYYIGRFHLGDGLVQDGQTMAFLVLAISQLFHSFNVRARGSIFKAGLPGKAMFGAFFGSLAIILAIVFIPPVASVFAIAPLNASEWFVVAVLSFVPIILVEIAKLLAPKK